MVIHKIKEGHNHITNWKFVERNDGRVGAVITIIVPIDKDKQITFAVRTGMDVMAVERWAHEDCQQLNMMEFRLNAFACPDFNISDLPYTEFFSAFNEFAQHYQDNPTNNDGYGYGNSIFDDMDINRAKKFERHSQFSKSDTDDGFISHSVWEGSRWNDYVDTYSEPVRPPNKILNLKNYINEQNRESNEISSKKE